MDPKQAAQQVAAANQIRTQVTSGAAKESRSFLGWGAFVLVMLPPFDVLNGNIWGPLLCIVALVGSVITWRYFEMRMNRIHLFKGQRQQWQLVWIPWSAWYAALVFSAEIFHSHFAFTWTVCAIAASVPLFLVGRHLARQGR